MMTLLDENIEQGPSAPGIGESDEDAPASKNTFSVPVAKAKGQFIEVDTTLITSQEMYEHIFALGLEKFLNARMSKVGSVTRLQGKDLADAQADAIRIAKENLDNLYAGKMSRGRAKAPAIPRELMTIARQLAKAIVNNEIRAGGGKPALVAEKVKTGLANEMIAADPEFWTAKAQAHLEDLQTTPIKVQIKGRIVQDAKLVQKAADKAAKRLAEKNDRPLSVKQAGMTNKYVPPRRPQAQAPTMHH
jgi:hypothetical protein